LQIHREAQTTKTFTFHLQEIVEREREREREREKRQLKNNTIMFVTGLYILYVLWTK
jgi:hypothetical protein